jgi:putative nucleotidyltransferase with HDIG domain
MEVQFMLIPLCVAIVLMAVAVLAARAYARSKAAALKKGTATQPEPLRAANAMPPAGADDADKSLVKWRMRPASATYSVSMAVMDDVNAALQSVPPFPQALMRVTRELDSAGSSTQSVADILGREPVLAANILRIANSASMGLRNDVVTVSHAVGFLGYSMTKSLIMRLMVSASLPPKNAGGYDSEKLWGHSMAVAQAAGELASRVGGIDPQLALTVGLLHDVGKLAINSYFPKRVAELWLPGWENENFLARERRIFGADHAVLGMRLATVWKLPEELIEMIRLHHLPPGEKMNLAPKARRTLLAVFVANQLVKYCQAYCQGMEIDAIPAEVSAELGLPKTPEEMLDTRLRELIARAVSLGGGSSETPPHAKAAA